MTRYFFISRFLIPGVSVNTMNPGALPPLDPQQRYSIPEASAYLRQSRSKTYTDIGAGTLVTIKDGKRTYIPGTAIAERSRVNSDSEANSQLCPDASRSVITE